MAEDKLDVKRAHQSIENAQKKGEWPTPAFTPGTVDPKTGEVKRTHEEAMATFHKILEEQKRIDQLRTQTRATPISRPPTIKSSPVYEEPPQKRIMEPVMPPPEKRSFLGRFIDQLRGKREISPIPPEKGPTEEQKRYTELAAQRRGIYNKPPQTS